MNEFSVRLRNQTMTSNLTREEFYELVWSKPKTYVAKKLGLSEVMVGKLCKEKASSISAWGFCVLAAQPGLEPGTYGLTENCF